VLLRPVAAQTVAGNLELLGTVSKRHEAQNPQKNTNSLSRHHLDSAHIDSLRVVPQPVAKVDALDVHLAELLSSPAGDQERQQRIFNVSVAPILALDGTHARNVARTESSRGARPHDEQDQAWQPERAELRHRA
jgi:hypothetical protein